jgi:hypothetical protein
LAERSIKRLRLARHIATEIKSVFNINLKVMKVANLTAF